MRSKLICCLGVFLFFLLGNGGPVFAFPGNPEEARSYLDRLDTTDSLVGMYEMRKDDFHGIFLLLPAPEEEPLDDYVARVVESSNPYDKPGDLKFFMRRTQEKEVFFGKYYDATSLGLCEARSGFVVTPGEISAREVQGFDRKPRVFVKIYPSPEESVFSGGAEPSSSTCSSSEEKESTSGRGM
ncbi:MAG TPA: hypothetical protein PLA80_04675 [Synergistaceae bacterium]|nr:hypothetical protein [Synergistaceae bacterium]